MKTLINDFKGDLKTFLKALLIFIAAIAIISYTNLNIKTYNYYYATHMKYQKNQYPFAKALAQTNMPANYLPNYHVQNFSKEGLHGFTIATISKENVLKPGDYLEIDSNSLTYAPSKKQYEKNYDADLDIDFNDDGTISKTDQQKMGPVFYRTLNDIQDELKRNSKRPLINLQWFYNWFFFYS